MFGRVGFDLVKEWKRPMSLEFYDVEIAQSDIDEYWQRGYWVSPKLMSDESIAEVREAMQRLFEGDFDRDIYPPYRDIDWDITTPSLRKVVNGWWLNDVIRQCVLAPVVGRLGAQLMRTDVVRLWHDQVVWKPGLPAVSPRDDVGNVGWHQDYGHWACSNTHNMCTAWIALQDTDLSNGGMRTIVGSHHWGLQEGSDTFGNRDLEGLHEQFGKGREWIDEPCVLKAGQASFHHALCFHGSGPNRDADPRLSVITHMMPDGTAFRGRSKFHRNVAMLGPDADAGTRFEGAFFPVIWQKQS